MDEEDKEFLGEGWLGFGWNDNEPIGYGKYSTEWEEEKKAIESHTNMYDLRQPKIEIRIYDCKAYDEMQKYYKKSPKLSLIFNKEFKDEREYYEKWLYRIEFGLPKNYQLKTVVPHPNDKNKLIHYHEYVAPHITMEELKDDLGKMIGGLILGAFIVWLVFYVIPWKTIFGFIFLIIQEITS
jgi:hypothetical protein